MLVSNVAEQDRIARRRTGRPERLRFDPVSEFHIDPELLRQMNSQLEPTIRAIEEAEPYARVAEIIRTLGPNFLVASGVAKIAEQFASQFAEMSQLPELDAMVRVIASSQAERTVAAVAATATLPKPTVSATGKAADPTLLAQFVALPCGQRIAVVLIVLSVVLYFDLPTDVQAEIVGLITVLGAAMWAISMVTRKR